MLRQPSKTVNTEQNKTIIRIEKSRKGEKRVEGEKRKTRKGRERDREFNSLITHFMLLVMLSVFPEIIRKPEAF